MAQAEPNRSHSLDPNAASVEPARSAYASPRLLKLNLAETEGAFGVGGDGDSQSGPN